MQQVISIHKTLTSIGVSHMST